MSDVAPKTLKSLRRWARIFLIVGIITSASGIAHNIYIHFNPSAARTYGRLIHVSIGGRDFAIPSEYFRKPVPRGETKSLYFWMMLPHYTPYKGEIKGDRADMDAAWDRHLMVRIDDTRFTSDLTIRYGAIRNGPMSIYKPEDVADLHGLRRTYVWKQNSKTHVPFINSDLFYLTSPDGKLLNFIKCDRDEPNKVELCTFHEFQKDRLLYTLSYRKTNLPAWQEMQNRVHDLIESFSCDHNSTQSPSSKSSEVACPT